MMRLSELKTGESATILKVTGHGGFRRRIMEMGFVRGQRVDVLLDAPLKDPVEYRIMGYDVSLRRKEAEMIVVISDREAQRLLARKRSRRRYVYPAAERPDTFCFDSLRMVHPERCRRLSAVDEHDDAGSIEQLVTRTGKRFSVALVGNPNSGKTTLFNVLSGSHEHVGNYSGVTVDAKSGRLKYKGYTIDLTDLPGTYALSAYTPEEVYVRRFLIDHTPDAVVNTVVASNLERNLYLSTEMIDINPKMVIALNMYDELERAGDHLDTKLLGEMIGVPVVPTISRNGFGVKDLWQTVIDVYEDKHTAVRHVHVNLGNDIEQGVTEIKDLLKKDGDVDRHFSPRYLAIKLLEHDKEVTDAISKLPDSGKILTLRDQEVKRIEKIRNEDITSAIAGEKYGFIAGALAETLVKGEGDATASTHLIDTIVTNKLFGFPIFLLIMFGVFWATFELGSYPMDWIQWLVDWLSSTIQTHMADGALKDMIVDGIIGGVGGVIVFLPNIMILYFCISWMEDSGYMARAAFIMDKLMHRIGLHGKSLVMGFGCNVPAIMSSRSIESRSSRIITILINPFMSCSARLPIYVLLVGTFFESHAALVFMGLYLLGIAIAMATALLLRKVYFKADETPFVMELPPYRIPTLKSSLRHTWGKGEQYLRKMGGVILVASIIVWALNYFPLSSHDTSSDVQTDSYLETMGKSISPVMEPIGFHWRASVAALAGVPAKEIVVSTLGVLYTGEEEISDADLAKRITTPNPTTHEPDFTPASALAFMIFILLYCPCIATIVAIVKETGDWRYGAFTIVYNTLVAWLVAFAAYRIALGIL